MAKTFTQVLASFKRHQTGIRSDAIELSIMGMELFKNDQNTSHLEQFYNAVESTAHQRSLARWAIDNSNGCIHFAKGKFTKSEKANDEKRMAIDLDALRSSQTDRVDGKLPEYCLTHKQPPKLVTIGADELREQLAKLVKRLRNPNDNTTVQASATPIIDKLAALVEETASAATATTTDDSVPAATAS